MTGRATRALGAVADALAAALAVFAVWIAGFGIFDTVIVFGTMAALGAGAAFATAAQSATGLRAALCAAAGLGFAALVWRWSGIMLEQEAFFIDIALADMAGGWLAFALIAWLTWRFFGLPMLLVFAAACAYALAPAGWGGAGLDWASVADRLWFSTDGVFGRPLQVVSTVVLVFIVFGAVLQTSGAGEALLRIAFAATGRLAGGPAHAAIVGSAMFGTMSGAAVANVVSTGVFTIPIIKRAGFSPRFAGAVEAAASTGGQIMPPVMGVVAFIMADVTGIPYLSIVLAALIPAAFYYASLFAVVLVEARKRGIGATPPALRERASAADWLASLAFWIPLGIIIGVMLTGRTPQNAGFWALFAATALCLALLPGFRRPRAWWEAAVTAGRTCATLVVIVASVGVVIGLVNMTGLGLIFADAIRAASGGALLPALLLVMLGCLVMGMGVPTVTAYLVLALVMGPALEGLGLSKIAAHLFMVYFGILSVITPPVALAAFAAAPIAGAGPMETGFEAVRLAFAGFIIPFIFVFHPDILIIDGFTWAGLGWSVACFALATWMIVTALARFEAGRLGLPESALRLALAAAILTPEAWSSLAGLGAAAVVVVMHRRRNAGLAAAR